MLYGYPISETIALGIGRAQELIVRGLRPPTYAVYGRAHLLRRINRTVHGVIPYPTNFPDLPAALSNRVWALIVAEKEAKKGYTPSEAKYAYKKATRYKDMTEAIAKAVDRAHPDSAQPLSYLAYYKCLVPVVGAHKLGNCGEYAALVVDKLLCKFDQPSIRLLKGALGADNNHVCVVLDADPAAKADDWRTYGATAVVCDSWLDLVAQPSEYFRVLNVLECAFKPNALTPLYERA
jgi:hypothetical protein